LKNVELAKPDRIIGSLATNEFEVVVNVTVLPLPDHPVIVTAAPAGVGKPALPLGVMQS
jgi:hypothetical protein